MKIIKIKKYSNNNLYNASNVYNFIRGAAKVISLENIMINNSLINYILVATSTLIFSILFENIKEKIVKKKKS